MDGSEREQEESWPFPVFSLLITNYKSRPAERELAIPCLLSPITHHTSLITSFAQDTSFSSSLTLSLALPKQVGKHMIQPASKGKGFNKSAVSPVGGDGASKEGILLQGKDVFHRNRRVVF